MTDAVSVLLARRQALNGGLSGSAVVSVFGHALIFGSLLVTIPHTARPVLSVVSGMPIPLGLPSGDLCGHDGGFAARGRLLAVAKPAIASPIRSYSLGVRTTDETVTMRTDLQATGSGVGNGSGAIGLPIGSPLAYSDPNSWYLIAVRSKIWSVWVGEMRPSASVDPVVEFEILENGSLGVVEVVQSSGVPFLDMAAKRAVWSASPFAPLPKNSGTGRLRIQAVFRTRE